MSSHECPTCERTFGSQNGLRIHHSRAHDERLPNRRCDNCATRFYSEHEKRYCSDACLDDAVSYEGVNNPNYSGAKEETTCDICAAEFSYYPSEKEGRYCSDCVETETWRHTRQISGADNPNWKGGKLTRRLAVSGMSPAGGVRSSLPGGATVAGRRRTSNPSDSHRLNLRLGTQDA